MDGQARPLVLSAVLQSLLVLESSPSLPVTSPVFLLQIDIGGLYTISHSSLPPCKLVDYPPHYLYVPYCPPCTLFRIVVC